VIFGNAEALADNLNRVEAASAAHARESFRFE